MSRIRPLLRAFSFEFLPKTVARSFTKSSRRHGTAPPQPLQSRFHWAYLWFIGQFGAGIMVGLGARHFAGPLSLPEPGSSEDELVLKSLSQSIDALDVVKSMRSQSYNLHTDTALGSSSGLGNAKGGGGGRKISAYKGWQELDLNLGKGKAEILGIMSGARGLGVQRAFWNAETQEMVAVLWIGGGLSGWPGVVHGGAVATVFEEVMARMVKGPQGSVELKHRPETLSITYAKPTHSLDFYIIRASFSKPNSSQRKAPPEPQAEPTKSWLSWLKPEKDLTKLSDKMSDLEIIGTLETVRGDLCVKAKGTFGG